MGHDHGSEYRLRIVSGDSSENLTEWLSQEELIPAMGAVREKGKALWLQQRNILCPSCPEREPKLMEYPVARAGSARYRPHDSKYLMAAGARNRADISDPK